MRPGRPALPHSLFLALVAAGTTWAALLSWRVFLLGPTRFLVPVAVCAVLVAVSGALLRWTGAARPVTFAVQTLIATGYVCSEIAGTPAPTAGALAAVGDALATAAESARTYEAPIGPEAPSIAPLLIVCGIAFVLLVDLLACTLRRVPLAGLPLLAIYSVPAGLTTSGPGALAFVGAAIGFLVLLHVDARDDLQRWGRPLGPAESSPWSDSNPVTDAVRAGAGRIGVVATALALVLPVFVPVLHLEVLGLGPGSGSDEINIHKPRADLRRDLERGANIPLLRVTTDDPDPSYLRIGVLNRFTGTEWSSGDRDVASDQRADGSLPPPQGLAPEVPRDTYDYDVEIGDDFDSWWLPTYYPAIAVDSPDDWRYDTDTMDFLSADDDLTTVDASYSMTAVKPRYGTTGAYFHDSVPGDVDDEVLDVPGGLPSDVRSYAQQVTAGASTDYEKAVLLQQWFRTSFRYDVKDAPAGTGGGTFETFLNPGANGRVGYCEQFASAMAAMARTLGIPARVAIGFLHPDEVAPNVWEFSSHDLHAWPELYFEGAGWVRFEPTPSDRTAAAPDYTRIHVERTGGGFAPERPAGHGAPDDVRPSDRPSATPTTSAQDQASDAARNRPDGQGSTSGTTVWVLLLVGLVALLLVGAAVLPRVVRRRTRARRLGGGPEEVWAELAATAVDLGVPWPVGRSPREVGAVVVEHLVGDPEPLRRIVTRIELSRYARPGSAVAGPSPELTRDGETCIAGLTEAATPRARRRAAWWPRSLWRRRADEPERAASVVQR
ncbi:MAG TPA: DUF3488 and transglutaminase-like domain-containing protein [Nocardioides sp.]|nr:DUF3488 and transglutaminase-like domain-containing protein [Nocardioides sp.]